MTDSFLRGVEKYEKGSRKGLEIRRTKRAEP